MNQIAVKHPVLTSASASLSKPEPARRLIVLLPDLEADYMPAMRRIWELANAQQAHVLLLSLCKDDRHKTSLRRRLITLGAIVQDGRVLVDVNVEAGTNWVAILNQTYQTGDTVVCFAEQRAGVLHKPLSQILQSNLKIPVYVVSGLYPQKPKPNWLAQILVWSGSLGIIAGFCILQINIVQASKDWFQIIWLSLAIISEFWLIGVLNSWF